MTPDELLERIRGVWPRVLRPQADPRRFQAALAQAFPGRPLFDLSDDFTYNKCHTFAILAHEGLFAQPGSREEALALIERLGGSEYCALLKLSAVLPFFLCEMLQRQAGEDGAIFEQRIEPVRPAHARLLESVRAFAAAQGFSPIPDEWLSLPMPGVSLDLAGGQVTVYNCLFEDQDAGG